MKKHRPLNLAEKGWSEPQIRHAETILNRAEHHDVFFSRIVFWSAIIIIIFANLMVSLVLIPFLIVFNNWILYSIVILLAGTVGFLYNYLITDIGHLERKHHLAASIIIPLLALANMILMIYISNRFIQDLKVKNDLHNPWLISIIFVTAFILPFLIDQFRTKKQTRKAILVR